MGQRILLFLAPVLLSLGMLAAAAPAQAATVSGGALTANLSVPGQISVAGQDVQYTFSAKSGKHLIFDVTATNWGSSGAAALRFYRPDSSAFDSCIVVWSPKICEITPDMDGTWTLLLDPADNSVGYANFLYAADLDKGTLTSTGTTTIITTPGQDADYTFPAVAGTHASIDITAANWGEDGSASLYLYDPNGQLYDNCDVSLDTSCDFYPNLSGTWRAHLDPIDDTVGSTTFALVNDQANSPLISGNPVTAAISTVGQNAVYPFTGAKGVHATFDVTMTNWGADGSATLYFYMPDGTLFDSCEMDSSPVFCEITPTVSGPWRAVLTPADDSVGTAKFTYATDPTTLALMPGTSVPTTISSRGQNAWYTFSAVKGAHTSVNITASNWGSGGSAMLYIFAPTGPLVSHCTVSTSATCEFTPGVGGTWRMELDPQDDSIGSTTFALMNDPTPVSLASGASATASITSKGQQAAYTFAGVKAGHVTFDVTTTNWGSGGSARLYFYQPGGTLYDSCTLAATPTFCDITPDIKGTWRAVVDATNNAVGSATFTYATDLNKGALNAGSPVATTITNKGQRANYTVTGTRGSLVKVKITAASWGAGSARLYIYPPTGTTLFSNCAVAANTTCTFKPNKTGSWRVRLDPLGNSVGSATLARS